MLKDESRPPKVSKPDRKPPAITVGGVTFTADQVKTAVVIIDGREIYIGEREEEAKAFGFTPNQPK